MKSAFKNIQHARWFGTGILIFLLLFPSLGNSQTTTQSASPPRYSHLIEEAESHLGKCETYFDSFKDDKSISYLKLADHFCTESIKAYYRAYYYYFDKPRFRMEARQEMGDVCEFYDEIYDRMRYYGLPHFKSRTGADYCREK